MKGSGFTIQSLKFTVLVFVFSVQWSVVSGSGFRVTTFEVQGSVFKV